MTRETSALPSLGSSLVSAPRAHQYVERTTGDAIDERLFGDRIVRFLYSTARERAPSLFRMATGARTTELLATLHFDQPLCARLLGNRRFLERCGLDLGECVDPPSSFRTARDLFERRIRYWDRRPMPAAEDVVVSPADARVLVGSLDETKLLAIKGKLFDLPELLGSEERAEPFEGGDFAVFRLTPDKYHYNHVPVSGTVTAIEDLPGGYHACNPSALVEVASPYAKNRRCVTLIDTDVDGGSHVGLVAMIEVVALMIGGLTQCYSEHRYDAPRPVVEGMFVRRGQPKSLYRPGSSTDVLLMQPGRVRFVPDLLGNRLRPDVASRFSSAFGHAAVETDVRVRSALAERERRAAPDADPFPHPEVHP